MGPKSLDAVKEKARKSQAVKRPAVMTTAGGGCQLRKRFAHGARELNG
jgi:hypothetical protein